MCLSTSVQPLCCIALQQRTAKIRPINLRTLDLLFTISIAVVHLNYILGVFATEISVDIIKLINVLLLYRGLI